MQKDGKTLINRVHDHSQAMAQHQLFDDDEHREEVEHTAKATVQAATDCAKMGRMYPWIESLDWRDFDSFAPGE